MILVIAGTFINRRFYSGSIGRICSEKLKPYLDFSNPSQWYPTARSMKRKIICHVGPTNSGKTFSAVKSLIDLKDRPGRGIYCAPLRLLAIEMFENFNRKHQVQCSLRTGEITCAPADCISSAAHLPSGSQLWKQSKLVACTVEMADIGQEFEVAVIDEFQMLADEQRGWAFTQAILGLPAKKIFLCGEEAAVPLIRRICNETGDSLEIVRFDRLSPLTIEEKALGSSNFRQILPGDCVVSFSRKNIFDLKGQIERTTRKKCAVVYGNLPMESRSRQAKLFNESGTDYSILVASDAIGMGLNLNIRRIIFHSLQKFNGEERIPVPTNQVKQIAGRAGRFGTQHETGLVTTLQKEDIGILRRCMNTPNEPLEAAGLLPTADHVVNLSYLFPKLSFPEIIELYRTQVSLSAHYFLCHSKAMLQLALIMEQYPSIAIKDRFQLACAPVKIKDEFSSSMFRFYIKHFAIGKPCPPQVTIPKLHGNPSITLSIAESVYRTLDLYLWLATHYPEAFLHVEEARVRREECGRVVNQSLEMLCNTSRAKPKAVGPIPEKSKPLKVPTSNKHPDEPQGVIGVNEFNQIIDRLVEKSKEHK